MKYISQMNVGQLLLVGIPGKELDSTTAKLISQVQPGGFIIFGRNIETPLQLKKLIEKLREVSENEPIITIDQEGGRVSRLRLIGEEPPNAQQLRNTNDKKLIAKHGELTGKILRLFGFNLNLCPVLDISFDDDADNSLRGRCYGVKKEQVIKNATIFNQNMRNQAILSCGKHFPGYSRAKCDAHHQLPSINLNLRELENNELIPFKALQDQLDSMMICHGHYPAFLKPNTKKIPASLTPEIIRNYLRKKMNFKGLIMTDDLDMGAIINFGDFETILKMVFHAGNDLAMICHQIDKIKQAKTIIEKIPAKILDSALENVAKFKTKIFPYKNKNKNNFLEKFNDLNKQIWQLRVETLGEKKAKEKALKTANVLRSSFIK